jgi:PAS domain S-box-containing protein
VISDATGKSLAEIPSAIPFSELPDPTNGTFYIIDNSGSKLALAARQLIAGEQLNEKYVLVGKYLDDEFIKHLAAETWFEQSILIEGNRVATSLEGAPPAMYPEVEELTAAQLQDNTTYVTYNEAHYYTVLLPILDAQERISALFEIALPVNDMVAANHSALLTLILSTILVVSIGSILGLLYARRVTAPLNNLTHAAQNISRGDFSTPVPVPAEPYEISTLAAAFEESRANTNRYLENLAQEKAWSDTLIQSISEGIVTVDKKGRVTSFNEGAERITGWGIEDALNESIDRILSLPAGDGAFMDRISPSVAQNQINVLAHNGEEITLSVTAVKINYPDTSSEHTLLVLRDVTEEIAAQQIRSYFLANISHEFRTPLSALNASVELLVDEIDEMSLAEIVELLNSIHYSVTGLQTLIDNLLESTSIEAGRFHIRRQPTDFSIILSESVRVMKPLLDRRHQGLSIHEPPDLPQINIDPTRLTQVMVNLLSNASKYSPLDETIELKIQDTKDHMLYIAVADHGPGISPHDRNNLFNRFVRLDARDGTQYGVGLGLSVVKTIVEEHGGKVGVDERYGGGSIFWFTIPLDGGRA